MICACCRENILTQSISCMDCETRHHLDCWNFSRGCSRFGCSQANHEKEPTEEIKSATIIESNPVRDMVQETLQIFHNSKKEIGPLICRLSIDIMLLGFIYSLFQGGSGFLIFAYFYYIAST